MTSIEAETIVAAAPPDVWAALLDYERWAAWSAPTGPSGPPGRTGPAAKRPRITFGGVEPLDGPADQVGMLRCATATVAVPLLGARAARWVEQVTDVAAPWTIEYEALARRPLQRWRLRFRLLAHGDRSTRVRCRLTYAPATFALKLADILFLRRAIASQVQTMLNGLARTFEAIPDSEDATSTEATGDAPHTAVAA